MYNVTEPREASSSGLRTALQNRAAKCGSRDVVAHRKRVEPRRLHGTDVRKEDQV